MLSNFLIIVVAREKAEINLALAIPTGASTALVKEMIDIPPLVALKKLKPCLCNQKQ